MRSCTHFRRAPSRSRVVACCLLTAWLCLCACTRQETPGASSTSNVDAGNIDELKQQRDAILSGKDSVQAIEALWELDATKSTVRGYYPNGTLALIEEEMSMGEFGKASSRYYYSPRGALFAYSEDKESQTGLRSGNPRTQRIELQLYYAANGSLLDGERRVDGK
ncbi:MAG: hypothetical protein MUF01_06480, partial [Bryobacterales bacterium]|nr:hypothetical protein [Bryobacterales bacterium]